MYIIDDISMHHNLTLEIYLHLNKYITLLKIIKETLYKIPTYIQFLIDNYIITIDLHVKAAPFDQVVGDIQSLCCALFDNTPGSLTTYMTVGILVLNIPWAGFRNLKVKI